MSADQCAVSLLDDLELLLQEVRQLHTAQALFEIKPCCSLYPLTFSTLFVFEVCRTALTRLLMSVCAS